MTNIKPSLEDAITQEPERFLKGIDFDKINKAKDPQKEFLRQIEKHFDNKTGLFLWQFLFKNYSTTNKFYKMESVQEKLSEEFKGNLDREDVKDFYNQYEQKKINEQRVREARTKKTVNVSAYKSIKAHKRGKAHRYTPLQESFILSLKEMPTRVLADKFNDSFSTSISSVALRDKKARLEGRKG